jgi:1-acyl-sn-glycerol-3-phosphate acyltransferase
MPLWEWFYQNYFRVTTDGWHHIPSTGQVMFVGSHNGGLAAPDMFMFMYDWFRRYGTSRVVYGLMHPMVWQTNSGISKLAVEVGAIQAHPKMALAALNSGASILVYPGGVEDVFRPFKMRHQIHLAGRKGFIKIALREEIPIIPAISLGAHENLLVIANIYDHLKKLHEMGMPWLFNFDPLTFPIYLGLPWGIAFGPLPNFPLPVQIHTRICEPILFDRYGREASTDTKYVDYCYELVQQKMQASLDELVIEKVNN